MRANSRSIFVPFVLWVSLAAFPQNAGSNPQSAPREQSAAQALTVPFELYDDFVFLQVRVNGSEPRSFVLDTGASTSLLHESLADSLGLAPKRQHETNIGAGESPTKFGFAKSIVLSLAGVDLPAQTVAVVPLAKIESRIGHGIDGIVGADLFKRYVVTIDYAARRITLDDPNTFAYHGKGEVITIRLLGNRPFFKAALTPISATPIEAEFVIDTARGRFRNLCPQAAAQQEGYDNEVCGPLDIWGSSSAKTGLETVTLQ